MSSRRDRDVEGPRPAVIVMGIVGVIIVVLVVILVIWLANKRRASFCESNADCTTGKVCSNKKCIVPPPLICTSDVNCPAGKVCSGGQCVTPPCALPMTPVNVEVNYNRTAKSAIVTWNSVIGATSYKVLRKLNSGDILPSNADETRISLDSSETFSNLATGTHYFSVISVNACGQSVQSLPAQFAPSCDVLPATPSAPMIVTDVDNCSGMNSVESVLITVDEATGVRPLDIIEGTGQVNISDFFVAFEAPLSPMAANLTCTGSPVGFTVTHVSDAEEATLIEPTSSETLGTSRLVRWLPIPNVEEYTVSLVAVDSNGVDIMVGGTTKAPNTSLVITTPPDCLLTFARVYGYKICNKSNVSPVGFHIPPGEEPAL